MQSLEYVCAATGERIGFEGPLYGETLTGLRARIWDYSLVSRGITGITRKTRETTITVKIHDSPETLNLLRRLSDADMASGRWRVAPSDHDAFHAAIRFRNRRP